MQEHRRLKRWHLIHRAQLKQEGAQVSVDCHIMDINLRGMQVALAIKLQRDVFLKMRIFLGEDCFIDVEAWAAWHKVVNDINVYGLYFAAIKEEDKEKVYQFIRSYRPQEIGRKWLQRLNLEETAHPVHDRRIFSRFEVNFCAKYLESAHFTEGGAFVKDISAKGVGLLTDRQVPLGTPLELWIEVPDKGEPLYFRGKVVWLRPEGAGGYRTGINLERADLVALSMVLRVV